MHIHLFISDKQYINYEEIREPVYLVYPVKAHEHKEEKYTQYRIDSETNILRKHENEVKENTQTRCV